MAKLATGNWGCPGCGHSAEVKFRLPNYLNSTITKVDCAACKSKFMLKFTRNKIQSSKTDQVELHQWIKCIYKSPKMEQIEKERTGNFK